MRKNVVLLMVALSMATLAVGCKKAEAPLAGPPKMPGKGSTFVTASESIDAPGAAVRRDTATDTVIQSHATIEGKSNCVQFQPKEFFGPMASLLLAYEPNGDVSGAMLNVTEKQLLKGASWQTFPFATKGKDIILDVTDTTYPDGTHRIKKETASYIGDSSVVVDGNTLATQRVQVISMALRIAGEDTAKTWDTTSYSFAPAIGYLVGETAGGKRVAKSGVMSFSHKNYLIHYNLKD